MLQIAQPELDALRRHGEETYPHECCRALLGRMDGDNRRVEATVAAFGTCDMKSTGLKINVPTPLRQYAAGQAAVDVEGKNVGDALGSLTRQFPDLKKHLYTDEGKLRAFVNVYVNDEDIRYLQKEATALKDGDTISIVPSIAGGCCALI